MATTAELLQQLLAQLPPAEKAALLRAAAEPEVAEAKTPAQDLLDDLADHKLDAAKLGRVLGKLFAQVDFTGEDKPEPEDTAPAAPVDTPASAVVEPPVTGQ